MSYLPASNVPFDLDPGDAPADADEDLRCRRCGVWEDHRPGCPLEPVVKPCGCIHVPGPGTATDIHDR